jgi:hypothetical protein
MKLRIAAIALALAFATLVPSWAAAPVLTHSVQDVAVQVVGAGAVGYTPEIATVIGGIIADVSVSVSADRRYVQINVNNIGVATIDGIDNFQVVTD